MSFDWLAKKCAQSNSFKIEPDNCFKTYFKVKVQKLQLQYPTETKNIYI